MPPPVPLGVDPAGEQDHCRPGGGIPSPVTLDYAWQKDTLQLVAKDNVSVMLPKSVDLSSIIVTVDVPESVQAPVERGQESGHRHHELRRGGHCYSDLSGRGERGPQRDAQFISQGTSVLTSPWFLIIMGIILLLIIVYIILILLYRRKQKQLRRVRKYRISNKIKGDCCHVGNSPFFFLAFALEKSAIPRLLAGWKASLDGYSTTPSPPVLANSRRISPRRPFALRQFQGVLRQQLLAQAWALPQHFHVGGHVGDLQLGAGRAAAGRKVPGAPQFQV